MAIRCLGRSLPAISSLISRSAPSLSISAVSCGSTIQLLRLRPISAAAVAFLRHIPPSTGIRSLSTRQTASSLNDPNPNWSNRPPKETILLDGCDFEHWLVVMEAPQGDPTRDDIIDSYIKTLAMVVGSEEEARQKIYSVSTRCYFAFGALVSEEVSLKIKELPNVRWVLPDSYLDVKNKDYGGEPFINGKAVPYDPKYHEEWIRNNARANERNRRNDRPRNFDRSRNFERRRENMQNRDFQNPSPSNMDGGPPPNRGMGGGPPPPPNNFGGQQNNFRGGAPPSNYGGGAPPSNYGGGAPPNNYGGPASPSSNYGGPAPPSSNYGGPPPPSSNYGGPPPPSNYGGGAPPSNYGGGAPPSNYGGPAPPSNYGGAPAPPGNFGGGAPPSNYGGQARPSNFGGQAAPPNYYGGAAPPSNSGGDMPPGNFGVGVPPNNAGGSASQQERWNAGEQQPGRIAQ